MMKVGKLVVVILALVGCGACDSQVAYAQQQATFRVAAGGNIQARDIIIKKGLTEEEVRVLFLEYQKNDSASVEMVAELAGKLAIKDQAILSFFRTLRREKVPDDELFATFAQIATTHLSLLDQRSAIRSPSPDVQGLLDKARCCDRGIL